MELTAQHQLKTELEKKSYLKKKKVKNLSDLMALKIFQTRISFVKLFLLQEI